MLNVVALVQIVVKLLTVAVVLKTAFDVEGLLIVAVSGIVLLLGGFPVVVITLACDVVSVQGQFVTVMVSPLVAVYVCPFVVNVVSLLHTVVYSLTTVVVGALAVNSNKVILMLRELVGPLVPLL